MADFDFNTLLSGPPTRERRALIAENAELLWAEFGRRVATRTKPHVFQEVVTYALLQGGTPQKMAETLHDYIMTGKKPWQK